MANTQAYLQQEERVFKSTTSEYLYFADIGKYFGLNHSYLQKTFAELGDSKFEKKQLKQIFNTISKNGYYENFIKDKPNIDLIHSTPLYKRLINESFWQHSLIIELFKSPLFGRSMTQIDKKTFCCEALTLLLYAFTSLSLVFVNYRLVEFFSTYPRYMATILNEVSDTKDIFTDTTNDAVCDYQTSVFASSVILESIRDTWIYDYIIGVIAPSIITLINFPNGHETQDYSISNIANNNVDYINIIFSGLAQMLSLMLHDKTSMAYFGNLPYHILNSVQVLPYVSISRFVLENFGKMFWRCDSLATDINSFVKEFPNEFAVKDGKLIYIGRDLHDPTNFNLLVLEKWIYATGTISSFNTVFDPEPMIEKLYTKDIGEYISYVITDLNTCVEKNGYMLSTVGNILDNYINANYAVYKPINIDAFPNQFEFETDAEKLKNSKQFKMFNDIVDYKINTELGPNLLIRTIKSFELFNRKMITAKINYLTFLRRIINFADEPREVYNCNLAELAKYLNLDVEEIHTMVNSLCVETLKAFYALMCNIYAGTAQAIKNLYTTLFVSAVSVNSYRVLAEGLDSVRLNSNKINQQLSKDLDSTYEKLTKCNEKYKQSKSENNALKNQLATKTKEHNKAINALQKSSATDALQQQITQLKKENEALRQEPDKLNQIIAKQKSRIESIEAKQTAQDQYEQRIRQLEDELARQEKLWQSIEEDSIDDELTEEEKYILSHLRLDMTVLDCESTKRLQKTIMTNSKFNFIPRSKSEATQVNFSQNADIYLLATDILSHSDSKRWQQTLKNKSFRGVYSPTNGYQMLCRTVLDKYYSMVKQNLIEPINIPDNLKSI